MMRTTVQNGCNVDLQKQLIEAFSKIKVLESKNEELVLENKELKRLLVTGDKIKVVANKDTQASLQKEKRNILMKQHCINQLQKVITDKDEYYQQVIKDLKDALRTVKTHFLRLKFLDKDNIIALGISYKPPDAPQREWYTELNNHYEIPDLCDSLRRFDFWDPKQPGAMDLLRQCDVIVIYRTSTFWQYIFAQVIYCRLVLRRYRIIEIFEKGVSGRKELKDRKTQQYHIRLCYEYKKVAFYPWGSRVTRLGPQYGLYLASLYPNGFHLANNPPPGKIDRQLYVLDLIQAQNGSDYRSSEAKYWNDIQTNILDNEFNMIPSGCEVNDTEINNSDVLFPFQQYIGQPDADREANKRIVNIILSHREEYSQLQTNIERRVRAHEIVEKIRLSDNKRVLIKHTKLPNIWIVMGCKDLQEQVRYVLNNTRNCPTPYVL